MRQVPECLNRRYKAMDELIRDLSARINNRRSSIGISDPDEKAIKLMCDFWEILEDNPDFDLAEEIRKKLGIKDTENTNSQIFRNNDILCYVVNKCGSKKPGCSESSSKSPPCDLPLSEVLCCLREASNCDQNCEVIIKQLLERQVELDEQIKILEKKQEAGAKLLKDADSIWTTMEDLYKKKLAEQVRKSKELSDSMTEIEKSKNKWRRHKVELEAQIKEIGAFETEVLEKINKKTKDVASLEAEIEGIKQRQEDSKEEIKSLQETMDKKQAESDATIRQINDEIKAITNQLEGIKINKDSIAQKTNVPLKRARDELQQQLSQLLQVQVQVENTLEQKDILIEEIEMHKQKCGDCKAKCNKRKEFLKSEMDRLDKEIKTFKLKCTRCTAGTDTSAFTKFCNDCPHCEVMKECNVGDDSCTVDLTKECLCTATKFKFLDNVFENMYTILEKQSQTKAGKNLAEAVLASLKKSKNGMLDDQTKAKIKDFIIDTVKNNLNMTVVGGAIKTRCEMNPETYNQLMNCLKTVKVSKMQEVVKEDKATAARKDPCQRWKKYTECQCKKGPSGCVCTEFKEPKKIETSTQNSNKIILSCPHRGAKPDAPKSSSLGGCVSCPFTKVGKKAHCVLTADVSARQHVIDNDEMDFTSDWVHNIGNEDERKDMLISLIEDVVGPYSDLTPLEKVSFTAIPN